MRVLFWTELFPPDTASGGAETITLALIQSLRAAGVECVVVTSRSVSASQEQDEYQGVPVYRFPFHTTLLNKDLAASIILQKRIAALKTRFQPDLIHINTLQPSLYFHQRTRCAVSCPTLLTIHEPLPAGASNSLTGREIAQANWLTTPAQALRREIERHFPDVAGRLTCVPNGLPRPAIMPLPLPLDPPRLLCLGRLVNDKGFDLALDAFATILPQAPVARLIIAGVGPQHEQLRAQAIDLKIDHAVDFLGYVKPDAVPALINSATIMLIPSRWFEVFPTVAVEAAWMARPVVATKRGGLPEVVAHDETGMIVEPDNSAALAKAVLDLLAQPQRASRMGNAARVRAEQLFAIRRMADDYQDIYNQLTVGEKR